MVKVIVCMPSDEIYISFISINAKSFEFLHSKCCKCNLQFFKKNNSVNTSISTMNTTI